MTRTSTPLPRVFASVFGCLATAALAQLPPAEIQHTMVSPSLPWANEFSCTVTNISSQPVTLNLMQIVANGGIRGNLNAPCPSTLAAGQRCTVQTDDYLYLGSVIPHCRVRYSGPEGALVGALRGSNHQGGTDYNIAVLPLQLVKGITLAPAAPTSALD